MLKCDNANYLKSHPHLRIPSIEWWMQQVAQVHVELQHVGLKHTLDELKKHSSWIFEIMEYRVHM